MRSKTILGVTVILAVLMQGCGRKAPLTLPAAKPPATKTQAPSPQAQDPQKSGAPSSMQGK